MKSNWHTGMAHSTDLEEVQIQTLYPGIALVHLSLTTARCPYRDLYFRSPGTIADTASVMQINYCHLGHIGWEMKNGDTVYLEPGDLFLHMATECMQAELSFPQHCYEGVSLMIDLNKFAEYPPEILADSGVSAKSLYQKFCPQNRYTLLSENEKVIALFQELIETELPKCQRLAYLRVKLLELLLFLARLPLTETEEVTACRAEHIALIRQIHEELIENLNQRITIDELAKQYLINTSTLKSVFKTVYGNSIAAHIREHRIEKSAELLRDTDESIAQIARDVGYENQSKYTAAFREAYQMAPSEYRKKHRG